jgi:hypothetical protein
MMPITYNVTIAIIDPFANMLFSAGYCYGITQDEHFGIRTKINAAPGDSAKNLQN